MKIRKLICYDLFYKPLKFLFKNRSKQMQQRLINLLPFSVLRFDLTSYFRNL